MSTVSKWRVQDFNSELSDFGMHVYHLNYTAILWRVQKMKEIESLPLSIGRWKYCWTNCTSSSSQQ